MGQDGSSVESIFDAIYFNNTWGTGSGPGSKAENALPYIEFVNSFMRTHKIKSILDLGMGDGQLLTSLELRRREYIGVDVSKEAISLAKSRISGKNIKFVQMEIELYNFQKFDLILCKDVLQHLPNEKVVRVLDLVQANCNFALICNDIEPEKNLVNSDCGVGSYRPIDIRLEPFNYQATDVLRWNSAGFIKAVMQLSESNNFFE